jgi:septal ring factor EnvC (AmiA/AmiB activator)
MTPLEIKILIYGVLALIFASGNIWLGCHFTAQHYEALQARDALARDQAIQSQQEKAIAALTAQQAATAAAEKQYADLKSTADGLSQRLADSLRTYTQIRSGLLSSASNTAALADATREGTQRNTELVGLVQRATEACLGDSAQLTGLQTWATSSTSH